MLNPEQIKRLFEQFRNLKIMIVGDVMVDAYLFGKVDRISPEAPVPVVSVISRSSRLGGAANVALNVHALGATPVLVSVIGNDAKGHEFLQLLGQNSMPDNGILMSNVRKTTTKFRVIGNNVQMLRVDEEVTTDILDEEQNLLLEKVSTILKNEKIDAVIFQDYDKGVLTASMISRIIQMAKENSIPVAVDPKKKRFLAYKGVQLFKPNLKELRDGLNISFNTASFDELSDAVALLQKTIEAQIVLVTLSEKGVFYRERTTMNAFTENKIPAHLRSIADVSGAGDTVISVAAMCLALQQPTSVIAELSNLAGGLVCEEVGVVPVNKTKLLDEMLKLTQLDGQKD
ncbi:MAG: D-glycero-beta-D-manno-heptose-7-phosphate kinase [Bacteroidetes bacterium]|jgi:D-glycero-beta-D-manno-heptose-7-phosphate kinase|nr:D-glycero-beta-D-manno-heptose-7-phosphate kinase [Bacteroidota bacterium]